MTTKIASATASGAGTRLSLALGEIGIVDAGVQLVSDDASTILGADDVRVILAAGSGVLSFGANPASTLAAIRASGDLSLLTGEGSVVDAVENGVRSAALDLVNHGRIEGDLDAVHAGADSDIHNVGEIRGGLAGMWAGARSDVVNEGSIVGETAAIRASSVLDLRNAGRLVGDFAVDVGGTGDPTPTNIVNTGEIAGLAAAIRIGIAGSTFILNDGVISAANRFSKAIDLFHGAHEIINNGSILAGPQSIAIEVDSPVEAIATITNAGFISGDIKLSDGNDAYRGRDGRVDGTIDGAGGEDRLIGGDEGNVFRGGAQNDVLRGRGGDDDLDGEGGADVVDGGVGDDLIRGGFSADRLLGKSGDDEIYGDQDPDRMFGGRDDDLLYGGSFSDVLFGGRGDDTLGGGNGFDVLHGGRGDDQLSGGAASDTFVLKRLSDEDVITDFQNGMDVIDLAAFGLRPAQFAAVVAPALNDAGGGATFLDLTQLGGNGSVLIQGLAFGQADASDFVL